MDNCSNCYTGCTMITTDKCMKYTGVDNDLLGIKKGDSQSFINQALIGFVSANSVGTGIQFNIPEEFLCTAVKTHFPECASLSVIDITSALSKAICVLDTSVTSLQDQLETMEGNYLPGCLSVDADAGTHVILQAAIVQVCSNVSAIQNIITDLQTNYVKIVDINTYIENYINNQNENPLGYSANMVPYTVVEYYGSLSFFDATGAGTGDWINIYLCNGNNNTPDKRGRVGVGTTSGMGGGSFSTEVNPALSGNPTYNLRDTRGTNTITLNATQIPSHSHPLTIDVTTSLTGSIEKVSETFNTAGVPSGIFTKTQGYPSETTPGTVDIDNAGKLNIDANHTHDGIANAVGGGGSHANIQPVLACHYIMFIPA